MIAFFLAAVSVTHEVTLYCDFKYYNLNIIRLDYICFVKVIESDGNLTHVLSVTGNHLFGRSNADVLGLSLNPDSTKFDHIPKGLENFFPNLLGFQWVNGNLQGVSADDLKPFRNLQIFRVYHNKLTSLDDDLFKHTSKLREISFSSNHLEHIGLGLLDSLNDLTSIYFSNNPCINFYATKPVEIQELKLKLKTQCPPLAIETSTTTESSTTVESGYCPVECTKLIQVSENIQNEKSQAFEVKVAEQNKEIVRQKGLISKQQGDIAVLRGAIIELEKQMREILSSPLSSCFASNKLV